LSKDEIKCEACDGTGFEVVKQPSEPGKRVYQLRCKICEGKGRVKKAEK
jgi:DnaJ-class molecular chaperone